jgi:3-oxoadipate enol-lactonase
MTDGLLLLHAFPLDASMWEPQIEAFEGQVRVVAPNFPGFGAGGVVPSEAMNMEAAAIAGEEALTEAGVERAVVCGLSMGGYAALALWQRNPDRTIGLVLANTRAEADDEAARERRTALASRLWEEGTGFFVAAPSPLLSEEAPQDLRERVTSIIRNQSAEAIASASLGMAARADFTERLGEIAIPTLVITSTGDALIQPDVTKAIAERVPGARLEVIDGAGHLSNLEAPEEFNRLLREHLTACGVMTA